jgi:hypothetical protein
MQRCRNSNTTASAMTLRTALRHHILDGEIGTSRNAAAERSEVVELMQEEAVRSANHTFSAVRH